MPPLQSPRASPPPWTPAHASGSAPSPHACAPAHCGRKGLGNHLPRCCRPDPSPGPAPSPGRVPNQRRRRCRLAPEHSPAGAGVAAGVAEGAFPHPPAPCLLPLPASQAHQGHAGTCSQCRGKGSPRVMVKKRCTCKAGAECCLSRSLPIAPPRAFRHGALGKS